LIDKNKSEEAKTKFNEINHAYEVLSEPATRKIYDQLGEEGLQQKGGEGQNPADLFSQFFGSSGGFGGMFGGGGGEPRGPLKAKTIFHVHKVSLEDIYKGKESKLALQKSVLCPKCHGVGGKEGSVKKCAGCEGRGVKTMMRQMGPMIQRFQTVCPDCHGEGEIIKEKDRCKSCHGKKTTIERKVLKVHVDRGVKSGTKIEFRGEGDQLPGAEPGDVVFEIEEKPHNRFQRKDDDLFYRAEIDLYTALAGGELHIEHLDERWLVLPIKPGEVIKPGKLYIVNSQPTDSDSLCQLASRLSRTRACRRTATKCLETSTFTSTSSSPIPLVPKTPKAFVSSAASISKRFSAFFLLQRRPKQSRTTLCMTPWCWKTFSPRRRRPDRALPWKKTTTTCTRVPSGCNARRSKRPVRPTTPK
jgi:DnaJ-class molecular chaperone